MKRSSPARIPACLSVSLGRRLNSYALAASAAGVGVLVLAEPAEGKIVYTPAHVKIGYNSEYNLDINHDGITDFIFSNSYSCGYPGCFYNLAAVPLGEKCSQCHGEYTLGPRPACGSTNRSASLLHEYRGAPGRCVLWQPGWGLRKRQLDRCKESLPGAEIRRWRRNSLRMGSTECDGPKGFNAPHYSHPHGLCIRNHCQQANHCRQD